MSASHPPVTPLQRHRQGWRRTRPIALTLLAGALALMGCAPMHTAAPPPAAPAVTAPADIPVVLPRTELVYEAIAELAPGQSMGIGPMGERRIVPITGGSFQGPGLRGKVLPGGADRQLMRKDGGRMLDALYEMQTDDGAIITVHNQVLSRTGADGKPYRFSHVKLTAPEGRYGWLNDFVYVGTLHSLQPAGQAVLIRVYRLL